jgi:TRAP-type C4-dicarboxylate transport system permease small subunit
MLSIMTIIIGFQVILRYVFDSSITWSEELSRYLCIWLVFIGSGFAVRENRHLCVDAFLLLLPARVAKFMAILAEVVFLVFAAFVAYSGAEVLQFIVGSNFSSPAMNISMGYVYGALPAGFILIFFRLSQSIWEKVREFSAEGGTETTAPAAPGKAE